MMSTVGLELINPDLTWKTVSKRNRSGMRRTRKPVAKSLTMGMGLADKNARTLEDVTVSKSEKLGVDVLGRRFCEKVENIPIKKRRFMFWSPSPPPPLTPYLHLEASEQHVDFQPAPDQNFGSSAVQWQQLMKSDCSAKSYVASIDDFEDFSGIEILAAAACSDGICNDVTEYEGNPVEESPQERTQSSASSIHLEETTASLETVCCFPKDSVNESKSEGSSFQDNSFAVLLEFPSDEDTEPERSVPLPDDSVHLEETTASLERACCFPKVSVNESNSEGSSFQDNSFAVLHEFTSDKDTTPERSIPFPDDRLHWDLNVSMDAWHCDGGDVDSQKDSFDNISVRSEELLTKEPQDIKNDTTNEVVSSDFDGGNRMTSDSRTMPVESDDLSKEKQESEGCSGYDSQFEDGELRETDVLCWEEAEQVDYDTEFEEERSFGLEAESGEQELKLERGSNPELTGSSKCCESGEALRKNSVSLKIRTVEVSDGETMKIDCLDGSNYDLRVDLSKESKKELLSCVEGSLSSDVVQKSRSDNFNGSYPRAERGAGSDKFMGSDRSSSHMCGRSPGGAHLFNPSANCCRSKRQHPPIYHGSYNFGCPRKKSVFENREYTMGPDQAPLEAAGVARPDRCITRQFMGSYRPLLRRRSPIERDDSYNMRPRMLSVKDTVRDTSPDRNRFRRYPQGVSRGIRGEYLRHIPDYSTQYMSRVPHCLDRRERSISPHGGRPHHTVSYKRAQSRSRSRSPFGWLLQSDRNEGSRHRNRSPGFRSDARIDRVRLPFTKRLAAGYGEFISPPRSRVSPQRNSKMFEDRNPGLDQFRGRKSHVRKIWQDQRFDQVRPIRRLNSNDFFNPMIRPRRFPDRAAGDKGCKYEVSDDGKRGSRYALIHRVRCNDTDGGTRQFRCNEEDSYIAKNSLTVTNATGVSSRCPDEADASRTANEDR